ncbi:SAM-dependent methyltransferase [Amycolatopsis cihanbeyliensis]|uniref:S-adenosyl methyltransferase n=1 Tax=Amycolatopsis cihanbeyliensis TaxID=1128664 RepID=A0A542DE85_AMYCI|nr:SAM-dependent methyltransferase [Amycolatopsis cihanbeyliensis]TQJ01380.1 S-adenosyl methyltransferase [Amycolatopsis cihanbeyliensis]
MRADEAPYRTPVGVDPTRASIARVYDAVLGGKDNYAIDQEVKKSLVKVAPEVPMIARDNREMLIRMVRWLVGRAGIEQILDIGAGLPTAENTHEVARRMNGDATVVYVDNDPVVIAHGRALLAQDVNSHLIAADLTRPEEVLDSVAARRHLDFSTPVALLQIGTLHHVPDELDPWAIMQAYVDALPSGSYVGITHFLDPRDDSPRAALARRLQEVMLHSPMGSGHFRSRAEIERMFCGLDLIDPGLALLPHWWPDGPSDRPLADVQHLIVGGLARKP